MSKLGAYRIVNLTYNGNSQNAVIKVIDETFELDSKDSLMLLRNGGGKTVSIQMLISPFVSPKYRHLGERKFEDYFTDTKNPTYIVTEWDLENNDKVMIGIVVKKSSNILLDEDSNALDIKSFIYEYKDKNDEFGIRRIPFSKNTDRGYTVMSMSESENLFKGLKSKNKYAFNYYDLNSPNHRSRYYEKLRGYSIEPTEWESIMRTINSSEGGLSELFKNSKTESALIEDWMLKNINIKLNREEDVVKEMGKSIKQYINNKQSKQNLIDTIHGIEDYKGYTSQILEVNSKFKNSLDKMDKKKSEIEEIMIYNHQTYNNLASVEDELNSKINELNKDVAVNKYEEASFNYHKSVDEVNLVQNKLKEEEEELNNLKNQLSKIERNIEIQDTISLKNQKDVKDKELEDINARIDRELKSNAEIQKQLVDVSYSLIKVLDMENSANNDKLKLCEEKNDSLSNKISNTNKKLVDLKAEEKSLDNDLKRFENVTKPNFAKIENEISSSIELPLGYNSNDISIIKKENVAKKDKAEGNMVLIDKEIDKLRNDVTKFRDDINSNKIEETKLISDTDRLTLELDNANQKCDDMRDILGYLNIDEQELFNVEDNLFKTKNLIDSVVSKNDIDIDKRNKKMSELDMIKKGVVVEVPKDVKAKLAELNMDYELGLNYLRKLKISDEQKEELLKRNPFIPFAIILEEEDIKTLKSIDMDIASSYNVYIANRDDINSKIELNKSNSLYSINNLTMLLNFNKALLSEEVKDRVIKEMEKEISSLNSVISENRAYMNKLEKCKNEISSFKITKTMLSNLEKSINDNKEKIEKIKQSNKNISQEISKIENELLPEKYKAKESEQKTLKEIEIFISLIEQFSIELDKFNVELEKYENDRLKLGNISQEISTINSEILYLEKTKVVNEASLRNFKDIAKEIESKLEEINNLGLDLSSAMMIKEDKNKLEAQFKALKSKSSVSLEELQERQVSIINEIKRLDSEIVSLIKANDIKEEEYVNKPYLIEVKQELRKTLEEKKKSIEEQQNMVSSVNRNLGEVIAKSKTLLERCKKAYRNLEKALIENGFMITYQEPYMDKSEITTRDFKEKDKDLKDELSNVKSELRVVEDNISCIKASSQRLDFLSEVKSKIVDINEREVVLYINEISEIETLTATILKEYRELEREVDSNKLEIDEAFALLTTEFKYKDIAPFYKNIQSLIEIKYDPITVEKSIESTLNALDMLQKQHETDLKVVGEERENISKTLLKYVEQVYSHMGMIDKNSRINIEGENKKMLEIRQPEWDVILFSTKIEEFLEHIVQMCENRIRHEEPIDEYIATQVTTAKLYDSVVGIGNVNIVLRKLEALNNQIGTSRVKWTEVMKNSGGEGFVSAFVILVSLLSYMRKDSETIGDKKEEGKVLIMDNPFGKMSSEHLIKPVMLIAEKYNTQLICYTAQKGDNIYNRFPNIYHLETEYIPSAKVSVLNATREGQYTETNLNGSRFVIGEQQRLDDLFDIK